jgi:hypothetical protein
MSPRSDTWRAVFVGLLAASACDPLSDYATTPMRQYAGCVVPADFVLAGVGPTTEVCLTFDPNNLQTAPGTLTSSDGRFSEAPLRPIPQLWNDPLSTLNFGQGRLKNLIYMVTPQGDAAAGGDITAVVSMMDSDGLELRLVRGAPPVGVTDAGGPGASNVFAVFPLTLHRNGCASLSAAHCAPDASP